MHYLKTLNMKLGVTFVILITLILFIFGIYNYQGLKSDLFSEQDARVESILNRLQTSLPGPIWNVAEDLYLEILRSEMRAQFVTSIAIYSTDELLAVMHHSEDGNEIIKSMEAPKEVLYSKKLEGDLVFRQDGNNQTIGKAIIYENNSVIKKQLNAALMRQAVQIILLDALIVMFLYHIVDKLVVRPINAVYQAIHGIAQGDGDLRQRLPVDSKDEIGLLSTAFNHFVTGLQTMIQKIMESSSELSTTTDQASQNTSQTYQDLQKQKEEISSLATAVTEMSASAEGVAISAGGAADSTQNAKLESANGKDVVDKTVQSIHALAQEVQSTADVIHELEGHSDEIGSILDVIRGIAEQTNLLALNAAIEAARAGEQGRGFAVVADEVRTLAQRTQKSTEEIQSMITQLQTGAKKAVSVMDQGQEKAKISVEHARLAGESLENISNVVSDVATMTDQIAIAAEEQRKVSAEIDTSIIRLNDVITSTVEVTHESSKGVDVLKELSKGLDGLVHRFKV